jgi:hypothetical protein
MNTNSYTFHSDPGHGWLEVPRLDVFELGIAGQITQYSYQDGDKVYLEEDLDMTTFANAYEAKFGKGSFKKIPIPDEYLDQSFVRNLPSYKLVNEK